VVCYGANFVTLPYFTSLYCTVLYFTVLYLSIEGWSGSICALGATPRSTKPRKARYKCAPLVEIFPEFYGTQQFTSCLCPLASSVQLRLPLYFCCNIILPHTPASSKWIIWGFLTIICMHFSSLIMQFCPPCCFLSLSSPFLFSAMFDIQPDSLPSAVGVSAFLLLCAGPPTLRLFFLFLMLLYFATWHMTSVLSDKLLTVCRCGEAARVHFLHNVCRLI